MSSKRTADRQITKDDREDAGEDAPVTFGIPKASAEQMKGRRVLKVRRGGDSSSNAPSNTTEETKEDPKKEASITEKKDNESATEDTSEKKDETSTKSNPFANISLSSKGGSVFGSSTGFKGFGAASGSTNSGGGSVFGSGFKGFGEVSAQSSSNGSSAPAPTFGGTFGGFASLSSSANQSTFSFGTSSNNNNDASNATSQNAASDAAAALPEDYKVESGEEGLNLELQLRCKSYRWGSKPKPAHANASKGGASSSAASTTPSVPSTKLFAKEENSGKETDKEEESSSCAMTWLEQGIGPARVLTRTTKDGEEPKPEFARLTQRRQTEEGGKPTKLLINCLIGQDGRVEKQSEKVVLVTSWDTSNSSTSGSSSEATSSQESSDSKPKPVMFLFKFKEADQAQQFLDCLVRVKKTSKSFDSAPGGKASEGKADETSATNADTPAATSCNE